MVVRGPQVRQLRIVALDVAAEFPTITMAVDLTGRCYVEDRHTAEVVWGDKNVDAAFTERWCLVLDGADDAPWRIYAVELDSESRLPASARGMSPRST
jgi:predicted lipid-binding transport protein (Tim44 family)